MKKLFILFLTILVLANPFLASAQHNHKRTRHHKDDNDLSGNPYGLSITIPPICFPPNIPPTDPGHVEADLSVEVLSTIELTQPACKNYFVVNYKVRVNNLTETRPVTLQVQIQNSYLPEGANVQTNMITLRLSADSVIQGSFRMKYAYILTRNGRIYYHHPYSITAETIGGFINNGGRTITLILDTDRSNNQNEINLYTPLPPVCIKPHNE